MKGKVKQWKFSSKRVIVIKQNVKVRGAKWTTQGK